MSKDTEQYCTDLEKQCAEAYESGVTIPEAERLAARCIQAQIVIARELQRLDLDARMKKNGVKAIKANAYLEEITKHDKKPSDTLLEQAVVINELVKAEQKEFDKAESNSQNLSILLGIFKDAHIYFRGISKGRYE